MRVFWLVIVVAWFATSCSTPSSSTSEAGSLSSDQSYRQAVDELIATTRTHGAYQSTSMTEVEACKLAYQIVPGRQSVLQYAFDARQLDLDATTQAEGQAGEAGFYASRIACGARHGFCVSYVGMSIHYVEIVSPTPEGLERALGALRRAQTACLEAPQLLN